MKKKNIIKENKYFEQIINNGFNYRNRFFTIYTRKNNIPNCRFGISIPKKIGNSVTRNKLKRQIKNIINDNYEFNYSIDYVIITTKNIFELDYKKMEKELMTLIINITEERKVKDEK
jgi:ribonuclease P protein component